MCAWPGHLSLLVLLFLGVHIKKSFDFFLFFFSLLISNSSLSAFIDQF